MEPKMEKTLADLQAIGFENTPHTCEFAPRNPAIDPRPTLLVCGWTLERRE